MKRRLAFLRQIDWRVLLVLTIVSVVLGILNNFRVFEEQRLPLFGATSEEEPE